MATKFFCDGCDGEINDKTYVVAIMTRADVLDALKGIHSAKTSLTDAPAYHLCDGCLNSLKLSTDPQRWPRPVRPG